jgi:hypothetical protein
VKELKERLRAIPVLPWSIVGRSSINGQIPHVVFPAVNKIKSVL